MRIFGIYIFFLFASTAFIACGDGEGGDGDGSEDGTDAEEELPPCDPFPEPETGDNGADMSAPVPAGQARAGKITDPGNVPRGVKSWAENGDFLLRNAKVGFVIEDTSGQEGFRSHFNGPFGGEIVYADFWGDEGEIGENLIGEFLFSLGLQLVDPETVTVMNDGSDANEAVVRVTGPLRPMPFLDLAAGVLLDPRPFNGEMYIDYILGNDDAYLQVKYTIRNTYNRITRIHLPLLGAIMGDGLKTFTPEDGFDISSFGGTGSHDSFGFVGENISYAILDGRGGQLEYVIEQSNFLFMSLSSMIEMEACQEVEVAAMKFVVAGGGAEALLKTTRAIAGTDEPPALSGEVTVEGGGPAAGARVHVLSEDGSYMTSDLCAEDGSYSVGLEPGEYEVRAVLEGHDVSGPHAVEMAGSEKTLDLEFAQPGVVHYTIEDEGGNPMPAKIMLFPDVIPDPLPPSLGEETYPMDAYIFVFDIEGGGMITLPAGTYTAVASRGFFYEIDELEVEITAGGSATADFVLPEAVDTTGYLCADFHQHSTYSYDTNTPSEIIVRSNAAEGNDFIVSTDHDWIMNFQPLVEELGLGDRLKAFGGCEITTFEYGHFNAYPMTVNRESRNWGSPEHLYRMPEDVFNDAHADALGPVIQINHPRSSGVVGGYLRAEAEIT